MYAVGRNAKDGAYIGKERIHPTMESITNHWLDRLRELRRQHTPKKFHAAIVLAAGNGMRFGDENGKHLTMCGGIPVIVRSALAFERCDRIDEIIVVTREGDRDICTTLLRDAGVTKLKTVVSGGDTRQISAKRGFDAVNPNADFVSIHDAARCLVTPEMIASVLDEAEIHGAAACAEKTVDTVKRLNKEGFVVETLDRDRIWLVKTPQTFLANMYRAAAYTAEKDHFTATDDCALVERLGFSVKLVDCGSENIKITYPDDIARAEWILSRRAHTAKEEM